jgi:hypothetical protein
MTADEYRKGIRERIEKYVDQMADEIVEIANLVGCDPSLIIFLLSADVHKKFYKKGDMRCAKQ